MIHVQRCAAVSARSCACARCGQPLAPARVVEAVAQAPDLDARRSPRPARSDRRQRRDRYHTAAASGRSSRTSSPSRNAGRRRAARAAPARTARPAGSAASCMTGERKGNHVPPMPQYRRADQSACGSATNAACTAAQTGVKRAVLLGRPSTSMSSACQSAPNGAMPPQQYCWRLTDRRDRRGVRRYRHQPALRVPRGAGPGGRRRLIDPTRSSACSASRCGRCSSSSRSNTSCS